MHQGLALRFGYQMLIIGGQRHTMKFMRVKHATPLSVVEDIILRFIPIPKVVHPVAAKLTEILALLTALVLGMLQRTLIHILLPVRHGCQDIVLIENRDMEPVQYGNQDIPITISVLLPHMLQHIIILIHAAPHIIVLPVLTVR